MVEAIGSSKEVVMIGRLMRAWLFFLLSTPAFSFNWVAFGEFRGTIEPCGCDPATDLGGLKRIGAFLMGAQKREKEIDVYYLGHIVGSSSKSMTDLSAVIQGLKALSPDAALGMSTEDLNVLRAAGIPFVLTNSELSGTIPYKIVRDSCVLGFISPQKGLSSSLEKLTELDPQCGKAKQKILLTAVSDAELTALSTKYRPELILRASDKDKTVLPDGSEVGQSALLAQGFGSAKSYRVPLGGAGVWMDDHLYQSHMSVKKLFTKNDCKDQSIGLLKKEPQNKLFNKSCNQPEYPVVWLGKDYETQPSLVDQAIAEHYKKLVLKFKDIAATGLKFQEGSSYVGSASCQGCHKEEYAIWQKSSHAHALKTLATVKKDQHPDCVTCHVVAYQKEGGYLDSKHTSHLAGVGCETCHGPGKKHSQNPHKELLEGGRFVCGTCHVVPHSPSFQFESYWDKIKHGSKKKSSSGSDLKSK